MESTYRVNKLQYSFCSISLIKGLCPLSVLHFHPIKWILNHNFNNNRVWTVASIDSQLMMSQVSLEVFRVARAYNSKSKYSLTPTLLLFRLQEPRLARIVSLFSMTSKGKALTDTSFIRSGLHAPKLQFIFSKISV